MKEPPLLSTVFLGFWWWCNTVNGSTEFRLASIGVNMNYVRQVE